LVTSSLFDLGEEPTDLQSTRATWEYSTPLWSFLGSGALAVAVAAALGGFAGAGGADVDLEGAALGAALTAGFLTTGAKSRLVGIMFRSRCRKESETAASTVGAEVPGCKKL